MFLARLPERVQSIVVERFVPASDDIESVNGKVRAFVRSLQLHLADLQTGVPLPGVCKVWHEERGFGFVVPEGGGPDIFVHRRTLADGERLEAGVSVTFKVEWDQEKLKYVTTECSGALPGVGDEDKLFVSGLPLVDSEQFVRKVFGDFGKVAMCKVLPDSGYPDRAALVRMSTPEEAKEAESSLHQTLPDGAAAFLVVRPAGQRRNMKSAAPHQDTNADEVAAGSAGAVWDGLLAFPGANEAPESAGTVSIAGAGTVKLWDDDRGYGIVVPDSGAEEVFVHRTALADGKLLVLGTEVSFEAEWDESRWKYAATKCTGARSHDEGMVQPSLELQAFADRWSLEQHDVAWLARLPEQVLGRVMEGFSPRFGEAHVTHDGIARKLRAFARSLQERPRLWQAPVRPEPSPELWAFGQQWGLHAAAVTWLACLPMLVQSAVMQKFRGTEKETKWNAEPEPSNRLFVTGLPATAEEETVRRIFGDYAYVNLCKIIIPNWKPDRAALVRVVDIDQAKLCIAGLNQTTPDGMANPINVRFADNRDDKATDALYVTGLPPDSTPEITEDFVKNLFGQHGTVIHCKVSQNMNRPERAAHVRMADVEQAKLCLDTYDQQIPPGAFLPLDIRYHHDARGDKTKATTDALYEFVQNLRMRMEPPRALRMPRRILPSASPFAPDATQAGSTPSAASSSVPGRGEVGEPLLMPARVKDWQESWQVGLVCPDGGLPAVLVRRSVLGDVDRLKPGMYVLVEAWWDGKEETFAAQACMVMHLYLAGLPPDISEAAITQLLAPFGTVLHCHLLHLDRMGAPAAAGVEEGSRAALVRLAGGEVEAQQAVEGLKGPVSACLAEQRAVVVPPPPPGPPVRQWPAMPAWPALPPSPVRPVWVRPVPPVPLVPPVPPAPPRRPQPATRSPFEEAEAKAAAVALPQDQPQQTVVQPMEPSKVWEWNGQESVVVDLVDDPSRPPLASSVEVGGVQEVRLETNEWNAREEWQGEGMEPEPVHKARPTSSFSQPSAKRHAENKPRPSQARPSQARKFRYQVQAPGELDEEL